MILCSQYVIYFEYIYIYWFVEVQGEGAAVGTKIKGESTFTI